jgi:hypothetical protein
MIFKQDYQNWGEIGSVRSARDYAVRISQDFDSMYVHAGADTDSGLELTLNAIRYGFTASYYIKTGVVQYAADCKNVWTKGINNINGVNDYFPDTFYRDNGRRVSLGLEHSLMTSGEGIANGVEYKKYDVNLPADFKVPYDFTEYGTVRELEQGSVAEHVILLYSQTQYPQFIYNNKDDKYYRYQFKGTAPHVDGETGEQLAFDNLIIIYLDGATIPGDEKYRLNIDYVGEGRGYYVTRGKSIPITWERKDPESEILLKEADESKLTINRGITYLGVATSDMYRSTQMNYTD